jgi:hypothetical protein
MNTRHSLRKLKVSIHNMEIYQTSIGNFDGNRIKTIIRRKNSCSQMKRRCPFYKTRPCHRPKKEFHSNLEEKAMKKSTNQYLKSIKDTPTQSCALCEMLYFQKDIYKIDSTFIHTLSLLPIDTREK